VVLLLDCYLKEYQVIIPQTNLRRSAVRMVEGWCTKHGDWNNWRVIGDKNLFNCPKCEKEQRKKRNNAKTTKRELQAVCGLCKTPLGKKSKGKKCGSCGAVFTNSKILVTSRNKTKEKVR
jgi:hypothetical protein